MGLAEEEEPWPENTVELAKHGRRFLVFSDGITEQFNPEGDMFGIDGLHEAFRRYMDLPLDDLLNRILHDLTGFRDTALVKDDQTLLALDFSGDTEAG